MTWSYHMTQAMVLAWKRFIKFFDAFKNAIMVLKFHSYRSSIMHRCMNYECPSLLRWRRNKKQVKMPRKFRDWQNVRWNNLFKSYLISKWYGWRLMANWKTVNCSWRLRIMQTWQSILLNKSNTIFCFLHLPLQKNYGKKSHRKSICLFAKMT